METNSLCMNLLQLLHEQRMHELHLIRTIYWCFTCLVAENCCQLCLLALVDVYFLQRFKVMETNSSKLVKNCFKLCLLAFLDVYFLQRFKVIEKNSLCMNLLQLIHEQLIHEQLMHELHFIRIIYWCFTCLVAENCC